LSGIGDPIQLTEFGIPTVAAVPGVGQNLMDRVEISVIYDTKADWVLFDNCTFGDTVQEDPCLAQWSTNGHHGLYEAGPGLWSTIHQSNSSLPYQDMWTHWAPAWFQGYVHGYPTQIAKDPHGLSAIMLKARTKSKGWVRLTGNNPQDLLDINKNLYATPEGLQDLYDVRESVKLARAQIANTTLISNHIADEVWPGPSVQTDEQIEQFIRTSAWGHHACCTNKIGVAQGQYFALTISEIYIYTYFQILRIRADPFAVLNNNFQVRNVARLRVVDVSVFPVRIFLPRLLVSCGVGEIVILTAPLPYLLN
jgi:choline dehydrogenase